eukprot:Ihof_evm6s169 gene=Ihof_evmTU6s169
MASKFFENIPTSFNIKNIGSPAAFLGFNIYQKKKKTIYLSQTSYAHGTVLRVPDMPKYVSKVVFTLKQFKDQEA